MDCNSEIRGRWVKVFSAEDDREWLRRSRLRIKCESGHVHEVSCQRCDVAIRMTASSDGMMLESNDESMWGATTGPEDCADPRIEYWWDER